MGSPHVQYHLKPVPPELEPELDKPPPELVEPPLPDALLEPELEEPAAPDDDDAEPSGELPGSATPLHPPATHNVVPATISQEMERQERTCFFMAQF